MVSLIKVIQKRLKYRKVLVTCSTAIMTKSILFFTAKFVSVTTKFCGGRKFF